MPEFLPGPTSVRPASVPRPSRVRPASLFFPCSNGFTAPAPLMFPLILIRIKTLSHCKYRGLCLPGTLTQAIRNFAKSLEGWLTNAMRDFPQQVIQTKVTARLCPRLGRAPGGALPQAKQAAPRVLRPMSTAPTPPHSPAQEASWVLALWDGHQRGGARRKLSFAVTHLGGHMECPCAPHRRGALNLAVTLSATVLPQSRI